MRYKIFIPVGWLIVLAIVVTITIFLLRLNFVREQFTGSNGTGVKIGISIGIADISILAGVCLLGGSTLILRLIKRRRTHS
jgi:hypothetical protein